MAHSNKVGKLLNESFLPRLFTVILAKLPKHCFGFFFIKGTNVIEKELHRGKMFEWEAPGTGPATKLLSWLELSKAPTVELWSQDAL